MIPEFFDLTSQITPDIYLGSLLSSQNPPSEVKSVICLCSEKISDYQYAEKVLHAPFPDRVYVPGTLYTRILAEMRRMVNKHSAVLVHCHAGISRSPTIVALYMVQNGLAENLDDAYAKIAVHRDFINPHPLVIKSARDFLKGTNR